jgi:hypothetical protein
MLSITLRIQSAMGPVVIPWATRVSTPLPQVAIPQEGRHLLVAEDRIAHRRARVPTRLAGGLDLRGIGLEARIEEIQEDDLLVRP